MIRGKKDGGKKENEMRKERRKNTCRRRQGKKG